MAVVVVDEVAASKGESGVANDCGRRGADDEEEEERENAVATTVNDTMTTMTTSGEKVRQERFMILLRLVWCSCYCCCRCCYRAIETPNRSRRVTTAGWRIEVEMVCRRQRSMSYVNCQCRWLDIKRHCRDN